MARRKTTPKKAKTKRTAPRQKKKLTQDQLAAHQAVIVYGEGSPRVVSAEELALVTEAHELALGGALSNEQFQMLMTPPPAHAIKTRRGGGGFYAYLTHGYVRLKLNQIFGSDWDHELLPVFNGEPYRLTPAADARLKSGNPTLTVYGKLTIRVRGFQNGDVIREPLAVITKTAFGSQPWNDTIELGDALKGAQSDSLKVCARDLGPALGLTLYWDEAAELESHAERLKQEETLRKIRESAAPQNVAALLSESATRWDATVDDILQFLELDGLPALVAAYVEEDRAAIWKRLQEEWD